MKKRLSPIDVIKLIIALIVSLALLLGLPSCRATKDNSVTNIKTVRNKFSNRALKRSMRCSTWEYKIPSIRVYQLH